MTVRGSAHEAWLGYQVVTDEGSVGRITRLLASDGSPAELLLVRVRRRLRQRLLAIPLQQIERVDGGFRAIFVRGSERELRSRADGLRRS